jgi:hypothetical protein
MPVKHIVMFTLKDDVPHEKVEGTKQEERRYKATVLSSPVILIGCYLEFLSSLVLCAQLRALVNISHESSATESSEKG